MKVYLDNCCFNRPFDDQTMLTIRLETEAKLAIQEKIKTGQLALAWSYIIDYENQANPFLERRLEIQRWKELADTFIDETEQTLTRLDQLTNLGLKPLDALHVACALASSCQYFLTVDRSILGKAARITSITLINPINFLMDLEGLA